MPGRHLNDTERRLLERWNTTFGPSLRSIEISSGTPLRGISGVILDLRYPLVVVAGKNGTGKSTFLACAACAYRNSGSYESFFFRKNYFNFNDMFVNSPVDRRLDEVAVRWTYRLPDNAIAMATATKGTARWSGYGKRPDRSVEFLGLIRALHPTELRVLRNYFGGGASISPVSLGDSSKGIVSCLMARNYDDVECATEGRYSLHILNAGGARYSGFHAGSGEDIACLISRVLNRLPDKSLLVIEEIETGLHPAAQRQLIGKLLELCWKKKLQVICSSHSQSVLEAVPADARVLLVRYGASVQPLYGISVAEAVSDMTELPTTEICVYVEDEVARSLVLETLAAETRKRVRVVSCGSWDDVIRFLAVFRRDPSLGNALGILDGDRRGRESEHRDSLAKYMGGNANEEDWSWLTERLLFLPGTVAPEVLFHRLGQEQDFRNRLSNELNAGVTMIDGFFSSFVNADPHNLPYELSQRVGLGAERVLIGLARATCAHKDTDFQAIEEFVRHRIDTGAP